MSAERPTSIPDGLVVELSRGKVLPGAGEEADRWMAMLNERNEECVASLDDERMAIEIVFRLREGDDDYVYWVSVHGPNSGELDLTNAIDRDHLAQAKRTKDPGWVEAEPQVLMLPEPVRRAVLDWALRADDHLAAVNRPEIPVFKGGGMRPGVDWSSNSTIQELLDEGVPPDKLR